MTTRAILKAEIIDDLERDATADGARVLSAISSAIKFYQPKRFFFNESRSVTFPTVDGTDTYAFGTDITTEFYKIDGAFVLDSDRYIPMRWMDYLDMERLIETTPAKGRPTRWTYINKALRLYNVPDAVYTVRLDGHVKIAEPASDAEADNQWFTEAYELIRCRAKAYLSIHVFPNPEMAVTMQAAEQQALVALRGATMDRTGTGEIIPTNF